jgi:protoheme IX farnesyltransferase
VLFAIQFIWQFPHFWAIAWKGHEDYQRAGYKLLPFRDQKKDPKIGLYAAGYALLLIPIGYSLYSFGFSSLFAVILLGLLAAYYSYAGYKLYKEASNKAALRLMLTSFIYLPAVLIILYTDILI